ncbi:MAG TPA: hypothetical protein VMI56_26050 [Reyranella sp.]|nr:hypothetical protein [Reyranella sp.]
MRPLVSALALAALASVPATGGPSLATYANSRFGYTVEYPADLLVPQEEAENGDGRAFEARHGRAQILVYGGYNALNESPAELAGRAETDCAGHHAQYRVAKPNLVAISCTTTDGILYQKTMIRGDTLTTLRAAYPSSERKVWDGVVARMSRSLVPAPGG